MKKLFNYFQQRYETPVERRGYSKYYFTFSALLILGTLWAVLDEVTVRRPWKEYQREFYELKKTKVSEQLEAAKKKISAAKVAQLQKQLDEAKAKLETAEYKTLAAQLEALKKQIHETEIERRHVKSESDAAYYAYKVTVHDGHPSPGKKEDLDALEAEDAQLGAVIDSLNLLREKLDVQVGAYTDNVMKLEAEMKNLYRALEPLTLKLEATEDAIIEVKQVMMNDFDFTPFQDPKIRVDRCVTCHLGWNDPLFEKEKQPYKTHSKLPELLATHNPEKFGCTPCHHGMGSGLDEYNAHGHDHYWEQTLLTGKKTEAACNTCHQDAIFLKGAPTLSMAKTTIFDLGCYGCHDINGFMDVPKQAPSLNNVSAKVKPQWVFQWIKNPFAWNAHTRMPNFKLNDVEAEAITSYLYSLKDPNRRVPPSGKYIPGSVDNGKRIVETVGCLACHGMGENNPVRKARGVNYDVAPTLDKLGSKLDGDWLVDWLKDPRQYNSTTRMPSLRLSDGEINDVASYLLSLKDKNPPKSVALDIASAEKIKLGEKTIRLYGCYGCHTIKGFENEGKVSVSLNTFGNKKVEEMDFGDKESKIDHTWWAWVGEKLRDPRGFATERIISRMPQFNIGEAEREALSIFLYSMRKDIPAEAYREPNTQMRKDINRGRISIKWFNCVNCHQVEGYGGFVNALVPDPTFQPPVLTGEGAKVKEPWLMGFLHNVIPLRPWIKLRMPSFYPNDAHTSAIAKYFLGLSKQQLDLRYYLPPPATVQQLAIGKDLFEKLQCQKCHPAGTSPVTIDPSSLAPNLGLARERLKPEWILEWLKDPQALQPGTRMPGFFADGMTPFPQILDGNYEKQIEAIRAHLISIGIPTPWQMPRLAATQNSIAK